MTKPASPKPGPGATEGASAPVAPSSAIPSSSSESTRKGTLCLLLAVQPALWAELLTRALSQEPCISILLTAADEEELTGLARSHQGAVILFDYEAMGPGAEGIIARVRRIESSVRVLVLARRAGDDTATAVLRAGAAGMVSKQASLATLLAAIQAVGAGEIWAQRQVTARVLERMAGNRHASPSGIAALTRREWEVVDAIGRGDSNRDIASALGISEKTVKTHMTNIFTKTGMHTRFAVALWAQQGLHPGS